MSTIVRGLTNLQGANVSAPTQNSFTSTGLEAFASDALYEASHPSPAAGAVYFNTTDKALRAYNGTAWQYEKTIYSNQTDATSTGANIDLTPNTFDQIIRFTGGSLTSIRSINPANQKVIHLYNGQAANAITLVNEAAAATAANRIHTGTGNDFVLGIDQIISLFYDEDAARWRLASRPMAGLDAYASDAAFQTARGAPTAGNRYWNTTSLIVREYDGVAWQNNKVLFSTENNTALTGSSADLSPGRDQIIRVSNASLTGIRSCTSAVQSLVILINATGATITIKNDDATATAANRILTGTGVDLSVKTDASIILAYDSVSTRWRVTGGSGSGGGTSSGINLCLNPNDVAVQYSSALGYGWYSSAATAASTTTTASEIPTGILSSTAIKITRTTAASYDEYRWKMPTAFKGTVVPISWYQIAESGMTAGDFKVDVYVYTDATYTDGTKVRKNLRSDSSSVTSIPASSGLFGAGNAVSFDAASDDYYGMRITRVAGTKYLSLGLVKIGAGDNGVAASQGLYETVTSYTIGGTTTAPTPGSGTTFFRETYKDGSWAIIRFEMRQTVAGTTGTGDYLLPLPNGLSIDFTRIGVTGVSTHTCEVGSGNLLSGSAILDVTAIAINTGAYTNKIFLLIGNETYTGTAWSSGFASMANANTYFSVTVRVPIVGWSDSVLVSPNNFVEYYSYYDTSATAATTTYNDQTKVSRLPTGSPFASINSSTVGSVTQYDINMSTPLQQNEILLLETSSDLGSTFQTLTSVQNGLQPFAQQTNGLYGMGIEGNVGSTKVRIKFGNYGRVTNVAYATAAAPWSDLTPAGGYRWRLRRVLAEMPAGLDFGQTDGRAQLYKAGSNPGLLTGATIPQYNIGEIVEASDTTLRTIGASASGAFNVVTNLSISLTAGQWQVSYGVTGQTGFTSGTGEAYGVSRVRNTTDSTNVITTAGGYVTVSAGSATPAALAVNHSGSTTLRITGTKSFQVEVGWTANGGSAGGATQYARNDWSRGFITAVRIA